MKVKILNAFTKGLSLEEQINDFIKDKKVIDIKYQSNCSGYVYSGVHDTDYERSVLIMYKED